MLCTNTTDGHKKDIKKKHENVKKDFMSNEYFEQLILKLQRDMDKTKPTRDEYQTYTLNMPCIKGLYQNPANLKKTQCENSFWLIKDTARFVYKN